MYDSCEQMTHQQDWEHQVAGGPLPSYRGVPIHKGVQPRSAVTCIAHNTGMLSAYMHNTDIWHIPKELDKVEVGHDL